MPRLHQPVFVAEIMRLLCAERGGVYLDATFGEGGHTEALLEGGAQKVVAIDRDYDAIVKYQREGRFRNDGRLTLLHGVFSQVRTLLGPVALDGIVVDLGPSTGQLLKPERGFSFSFEGPLDMRMDQGDSQTLIEYLKQTNRRELEKILSLTVNRAMARRLTDRVWNDVRANKVKTTLDLARPAGKRRGKRHPATEFFLALRMWVNRELEEIELGLPEMVDLLKPEGRLAVITFHSTEDRLVKTLFKKLAGRNIEFFPTIPAQARVRWLTKHAIQPTREEILKNARSRSAKLRCVEKLGPRA